ncbi:MAG: hypothetical protein HYW93_02260 [Thaumarchaeota archaeon]|nr:hypothetical protein [Nitrososphaerota archaeon]
MRTVLFDSSFLMAIMEHPTTWYEDILESVGSFKPTVLDVVQQELANVSKGGGKRSRFAALALELSSNFTAVKARSKNGKPDDELISYAKEKMNKSEIILYSLPEGVRSSQSSSCSSS